MIDAGVLRWENYLESIHDSIQPHAVLIESPPDAWDRIVFSCVSAFWPSVSDKENSCSSVAGNQFPGVRLFGKEKKIDMEDCREIINDVSFSDDQEKLIVMYGIDKASIPAANSLLKTLEEPRSGVNFLLLTDETSAVIPTIKSRCWVIQMGLRMDAAFMNTSNLQVIRDMKISEVCKWLTSVEKKDRLDVSIELRQEEKRLIEMINSGKIDKNTPDDLMSITSLILFAEKYNLGTTMLVDALVLLKKGETFFEAKDIISSIW